MKTTYCLEVIAYSDQQIIIDELLSEKKFNSIKNRLDSNFYETRKEVIEEALHIVTTIEYIIYDTQIILTKVESK